MPASSAFDSPEPASGRALRDEDLEMVILATLARGERTAAALQVALERFGSLTPAVTESAVGVLVRRLERDGLIIGQWRVADRGPAVKRLRLTEAGIDALAERRAAWRHYVASIDALMDPEVG